MDGRVHLVVSPVIDLVISRSNRIRIDRPLPVCCRCDVYFRMYTVETSEDFLWATYVADLFGFFRIYRICRCSYGIQKPWSDLVVDSVGVPTPHTAGHRRAPALG